MFSNKKHITSSRCEAPICEYNQIQYDTCSPVVYHSCPVAIKSLNQLLNVVSIQRNAWLLSSFHTTKGRKQPESDYNVSNLHVMHHWISGLLQFALNDSVFNSKRAHCGWFHSVLSLKFISAVLSINVTDTSMNQHSFISKPALPSWSQQQGLAWCHLCQCFERNPTGVVYVDPDNPSKTLWDNSEINTEPDYEWL